MSNVVTTVCSGCMEPVKVNVVTLTVTMRVPSNGKRGSLHVAAHTVTTEATSDGDLVMWDCPRCEYADSVYQDADVRKALA